MKDDKYITETEFYKQMLELRKDQNDLIKWALGIPAALIGLVLLVITLLKVFGY